MASRARQWRTRLTREQSSAYRASGQWRAGTIVERFRSLVEAGPDAPILLNQRGSLCRSGLWEQARGLAASLRSLGIGPGDVVSFQLPNWAEVAVIDLACAMSGIIVNPIVPIYREKELEHILNDCRTRLIFVPQHFRGFDHAEAIDAMRSRLPFLDHVVILRPQTSTGTGRAWDTMIASDTETFSPCPADADAVKMVMYTSGTTGPAKSVLHSHSTIDAEVRAVAEHYCLAADDLVFMPSPVTHITGYLYGIQIPLTYGIPAVLMEQWDKDAAVEIIRQQQCTFTVGATPFLQELCAAVRRRNISLPSLRYFLCGGAPVSPDTIYESRAVLEPCIPGRVYGSTEAPTITLGPTRTDERRLAAETDGKAIGYEIKLLGEDGKRAEHGEGEIAVRGPEVFLGYGDPARDAEAFDAEGFFLTGDLARMDEDGCLTIIGRKKDIIIRGGENISAKEVEDVLHAHPLISEAAVVAMPHARLGETCCAVVALSPGAVLSDRDIIAYVAASGLAKQKIPERVEFKDALPKTASGKVLKVKLRFEIAALLARP